MLMRLSNGECLEKYQRVKVLGCSKMVFEYYPEGDYDHKVTFTEEITDKLATWQTFFHIICKEDVEQWAEGRIICKITSFYGALEKEHTNISYVNYDVFKVND